MTNRSATDTIKGYFYQFDYSIKKILESPNPNDSVTIEGIEDIDVESATDETAIQCKYYAKTEYNHSVIGKPIRFMLTHFMNDKKNGKSPIKYSLYGFYKGGHHKLVLPISVDDLKDNFLSYTEKGVKQLHHINISASDSDLGNFISHLEINIHAQEYDEQLKSVLDLLKTSFSSNDFETEYFYYNNALNAIRELAIKNDINDRTITKSDFLSKINSKAILFNTWFLEYKGLKKHFKELKAKYFTGLNSSSFDRFFLLEIDKEKYLRADLKELIFLISKKWSKISRREANPFCPYIYIHGIAESELIDLKRELSSEEFVFIDGYSFHGADFNVKSILIKPNSNNGILLKFLNEQNHLEQVLAESNKTKEIYQFYYNQPYYTNDSCGLKHTKIQIQELKNIKEII
jgi:hypothetical protein